MANAARGRLIFYPDVANLRDLAAVSLTAHLLQDHIVERRRCRQNFEPFNERAEEYFTVRVPVSVKYSIGALARLMDKNRTNWWYFHYAHVFDRSCRNDMIDVLAELVWLPDGSIDHEATARRMLNDTRLTAVEKFRMAAMYCFEDHVKRAWTDMGVDSRRKLPKMTNFPQIAFWCGKMMDEQHVGGISMICYQIMHMLDFENWSAIKYFWNACSAAERRTILDDVMSSSTKPGIMIKLLAQLPVSKVESLCRHDGRHIIWAMASVPKYSKHVLVVYQRMLELQAVDVELLGDSLIDVWMEDYRRGRLHVNEIILRMWQNTSEELKNAVALRWATDLIEKPLDRILRDSKNEDNDDNYNIPFIFDILKRRDQQYRSDYWQKYWLKLTVGQMLRYPDLVEQIMKLCLVTDEQIATFKATNMLDIELIKPLCQKLIAKGRFEDVQRYVDLASSKNTKKAIDLKRKILKTSYEQVFACLIDESMLDSFKNFDEFIRGTYNSREIQTYKSLFFMSQENTSALLDIGSMIKAKRFVEKMLTDDELLPRVKGGLLHSVRAVQLENEVFYMSKPQWDEFVGWCCDHDPARVEKFKKSLKIDQYFAQRVVRLVNWAIISIQQEPDIFDNHSVDSRNQTDPDDAIPTLVRYLDDFDQFLVWKFETKPKVNEFKSRQIQMFEKLEDLKKILKGEYGQGIVEAVLLWAFDRDNKRIQIFKKAHRL